MLILGIETSSPAGSVALLRNGRVVASKIFTRSLGHSSRLVPAIDALLKKGKGRVENIDAMAVGVGPGSYTGLRVGIATARGLAALKKIPVIGIPSVDALVLAHQNKIKKEVEAVYAVVDAKREEHYLATYKRGREGFVRLGSIEIVPNAKLDKMRTSGETLLGPDENRCYPTAEAVALLAEKKIKRGGAAGEPRPIYIRPFIPKKSEEHKYSCFIAAGRK